jgi:hypothetical protein
MNFLKHAWNGIKVGWMIPTMIPVMFVETNGSGAGPAFAKFLSVAAVVTGGIFLALSIAGGFGSQMLGVPLPVGIVGLYFSFWALLGILWKME